LKGCDVLAKVVHDTKILRRLAMFSLNRKTDQLNQELYEYLTMLALSEDKDNKGMVEAEIVSSIIKDLSITELPIELIRTALERLVEKRYAELLHNRGKDVYFLSQDKVKSIEIMNDFYSKTILGVKKELANKINQIKESPIDIGLENKIFAKFQKILGIILSELGEECCFKIITSEGKELSLKKATTIISTIEQELLDIEDIKLREAGKNAFLDYLSQPDDNLSDYLFSLAQSYFIINVLRLDPECNSYTKKRIQETKIYLDTNVIMHALIGSESRNVAADSALKLASKMGINLFFTKLTKQEYEKQIRDAKQRLGSEPNVPEKRFEKVRSKLEDGLLKDYLAKKQQKGSLNFSSYLERLGQIETLLSNRYGVIYDDKDYKDIKENPDLPELKKVVADVGEEFYLYKSATVAEHDAFHILMIQDYRKSDKGDIIGPKYWFLTHDNSLDAVERKFGKFDDFPSSIYLDNWVQLISLFLSPELTKTARDTYLDFFASRLPVMSKAMDEEVFITFQGDWVDDEDLTPEDVARIIGNRSLKSIYKELEEKKKQLTDEERDLIIAPAVEQLKTQKKEDQELHAQIDVLDKKVDELQGKVSTLEADATKKSNVINWFTRLFGACVFIILWFVLYQYVLINTQQDSWIALFGATFLAAVFGYLAGFRGFKWLVERMMKQGLDKKRN
jgi:predicted nucleic acid-binding protein